MVSDILALLLLPLGIGMFAAVITVGVWILRPLDRAAKGREHPTQFTIADVLCLFVLIQFPTSLIHWGVGGTEYQAIWMLDGFVWIACGLMWWVSVQRLSRAGIRHTWHRAFFLAFVLPVTFFGAIVFPGLTLALPFMIVESYKSSQPWPAIVLLVIDIALGISLYVSGTFTRRMVRAADE